MIRWLRLWAITQKELRQLARDRLTFGAWAVMSSCCLNITEVTTRREA
ncbi:hypothetical protein M2366_003385 [Aeromonas sp. BIGb0405]|nr:hypothetical protein [Aeromonas sp. BIGb0405]MCS3457271.1 hypothetical protein [Aeromonas sp. BIGb0405]